MMIRHAFKPAFAAAAMLAAFATTGAPALAQPATGSAAPAVKGPVVTAQVATLQGRVAAIDTGTRLVTLKSDDGRSATVFVGPDIRNFSNLKVGDQVTMRYTRAQSLALAKGAAGDEARVGELRTKVEAQAAAQPAAGGKPGLSAMERTTLVANVFEIDRQRGTVTLRGTSGVPVEVQVSDPQMLSQIGINDQVVIGYRHAAAISIQPGSGQAAAGGASKPGGGAASAPSGTSG